MRGNEDIREAVKVSLKLGALLLLLIMSFKIIEPMLLIGVWGVIIAVGAFPVYRRLTRVLRGKEVVAAAVICIGLIFILLLPIGVLAANTAKTLEVLAELLEEGRIVIPPPAEGIREVPVIGENLYDAWEMASTNLMEVAKYALPYIKSLGPKVLTFAGNLGISMMQTLVSIGIAGVFMVYGQHAGKVSDRVSKVLLGEYISNFTEIAVGTIRSVVQGIIGVGVIQGTAAGIGLSLAKVPGAGVLTLLTIFVCVVQLPPILILVPVAIYLFATSSLITAILFSIWVIVITFGDTPLRALLFGRGLEVPSMVIFVGTIGGVLNWGIVGLFIGAVVLALGYKFILSLLKDEVEEKTEVPAEEG